MALTAFLILVPVVTILVFWRYRSKSNLPKKDNQTDFFELLEDDKGPARENEQDDSTNS